MIIDFRQGIITYPTSSGLQRFLEFADGFVGINAADGRTDVTFANGDENYLHNETVSIPTAWGPITPNVDAWLYWNLNGLTAHRTFGVTYVQPVVSASAPTAPVNDLHWFDTTNNIMRVYTSGKWVTRIRTFACKINNATISPMGSGVINRPFAGTQVGIQGVNIPVGRIIVDAQGQPIRKQNGQLFTTEDEFFINGSPINTIRLEANVFQAQAVENIAKYQPVKFVDFGKVALATYNDTYTTTIAMAMEDIIGGDVGTLCMQGVISSPDWNWPAVGKPLWIHGSIPGLLVDYDPHVQSAGTYKVAKPPVGRVISRSSIFFDQGLGGKGDKGDAGDADVPLATTTVFGISKLSVDAADPANPIVVGDNDPRNFNDRYPLPHNQAATTIIPSPTGILTGVNLQQTLQIINDSFVKRAGDSMTGYLVLSSDPAQDMHAATKHYVDTRPLNSLADVTISNPVANEILKYDGTGWVNGESAGGPDLWMVSSRTNTAIAIDPILTPSPHVPPYDEVYVPLHTVIDSDPPSLYIPFWMDAIGSGAGISCMRSIGKIAIGAPGSADNIYRSEPTLYSVGSYWNTTANQSGVVVSVHHVDGEQPGHLITTGGYKGRVIVPLISHEYWLNANYAIGCGIGVGNANGGVYVLTSYMANTSWYSSAEGIVILTCFDPTLATVTWCKTYQINSTDSDTVSATQSVAGFVVNPITNISYIALETVRTYVDSDGATLSDIGMSVIAVNGSGNTLWHRHMKALNASNVATTYAPASIAVHNESGDVVVSCGNTVVKLSGSSGNTIWATQHTTIEFDTRGAVLHDIAVDQSTGDVYVTAYQSLQLG